MITFFGGDPITSTEVANILSSAKTVSSDAKILSSQVSEYWRDGMLPLHPWENSSSPIRATTLLVPPGSMAMVRRIWKSHQKGVARVSKRGSMHREWHFFHHYTRICQRLCCLYNLSYLILMGFLLTKPFQIHLWAGPEPGLSQLQDGHETGCTSPPLPNHTPQYPRKYVPYHTESIWYHGATCLVSS